MNKIISSFMLVILVNIMGCDPGKTPPATAIDVAKVIEIPLQNVDAPNAETMLSENPGALAVTPGYEDELPDGPTSFDVSPDGGFVITDPLQSRIVFYDANGAFSSEKTMDFAPTRLQLLDAPGDILIERRGTEDYYIVSGSADPAQTTDAQQIARFEKHRNAKLNDRNSGTVSPDGKSPITVTFENDSLFLISVQLIGTMGEQTFVLLETTSGNVPITVHRFMRIYDASGKWTANIAGLDEDHHVFPDDEFRLSNGKLYQMSPGTETLRIQVWDVQQP